MPRPSNIDLPPLKLHKRNVGFSSRAISSSSSSPLLRVLSLSSGRLVALGCTSLNERPLLARRECRGNIRYALLLLLNRELLAAEEDRSDKPSTPEVPRKTEKRLGQGRRRWWSRRGRSLGRGTGCGGIGSRKRTLERGGNSLIGGEKVGEILLAIVDSKVDCVYGVNLSSRVDHRGDLCRESVDLNSDARRRAHGVKGGERSGKERDGGDIEPFEEELGDPLDLLVVERRRMR